MKLFIIANPLLVQTIFKIANSDVASVSAKTLYKANKLLNKVQACLKDFEDVRGKLIKKYAKKDENGEVIITKNEKDLEIATFETENIDTFNREFTELMNSESEEDFNIKFDVSEFEKLATFSGPDLNVLMSANLIIDN